MNGDGSRCSVDLPFGHRFRKGKARNWMEQKFSVIIFRKSRYTSRVCPWLFGQSQNSVPFEVKNRMLLFHCSIKQLNSFRNFRPERMERVQWLSSPFPSTIPPIFQSLLLHVYVDNQWERATAVDIVACPFVTSTLPTCVQKLFCRPLQLEKFSLTQDDY